MCIECKYYKGICTNPNDCANKKDVEKIRVDAISEYENALIYSFKPILIDLEEIVNNVERIAERLKEQK